MSHAHVGYEYYPRYAVTVQRRATEILCHRLRFDEICTLAFPEATSADFAAYTVTSVEPSGQSHSICFGEIVDLENGMIFNVAPVS